MAACHRPRFLILWRAGGSVEVQFDSSGCVEFLLSCLFLTLLLVEFWLPCCWFRDYCLLCMNQRAMQKAVVGATGLLGSQVVCPSGPLRLHAVLLTGLVCVQASDMNAELRINEEWMEGKISNVGCKKKTPYFNGLIATQTALSAIDLVFFGQWRHF